MILFLCDPLGYVYYFLENHSLREGVTETVRLVPDAQPAVLEVMTGGLRVYVVLVVSDVMGEALCACVELAVLEDDKMGQKVLVGVQLWELV